LKTDRQNGSFVEQNFIAMTRKILFSLPFLLFNLWAHAQPLKEQADSTIKEKPVERKTQIKSTARLHTRGMFLYGGRISTDNPAFDINFTLNRPKWGFLFYKAIDLKDHTSLNNFALALVYKNFKISDRLTFTPHVGTFLEQAHTIADWGSDILGVAVLSYKVNHHFTLDYTALLANLVVETELMDWVNRGRILFVSNHIDITGSFWHNNHVFDEHDHVSGALSVSYGRIRLSESINLSIGATEFVLFHSSDEETVPATNRFLLTVAMQFVK